ncbi:universal stress protein [Trinickia terrae]|uniref:Universal stress protein n=1 Tax=Trinickia terrae TaxID=2571161 RepID=A0A4V5PI67_9BURK|nr:universal stress protein [Trinickia terrae]TKC86220.1 universal stress protein [Trinickia terrae]
MLKILVPVSRSARSLQAVRHAAFLFSERCASEVVLVNVQPPLESTRLEAFYPLSKLRSLEDSYAHAALGRAEQILKDAGVKYSVMIQVGPLVPTIAECAEQTGCDEILLAAPRTDPLHTLVNFFSRSVLNRLLRISRVPVTAVR